MITLLSKRDIVRKKNQTERRKTERKIEIKEIGIEIVTEVMTGKGEIRMIGIEGNQSFFKFQHDPSLHMFLYQSERFS